MDRRALLSTAGGLLSLGCSGCLGSNGEKYSVSVDDATYRSVVDPSGAADAEASCDDPISVTGRVPRDGCYEVEAFAGVLEGKDPTAAILELVFDPVADSTDSSVCVSEGGVLEYRVDLSIDGIRVEGVNVFYRESGSVGTFETVVARC